MVAEMADLSVALIAVARDTLPEMCSTRVPKVDLSVAMAFAAARQARGGGGADLGIGVVRT